MEKKIEEFVKKWLESQEEKKFFEPDKDGYVMFRRGSLSINLPAYLEMILVDYIEAQAALSKAEKAENYILITDVKNIFNASVFFYELMQVANIKNEDGMQVVEYVNKPNGGSVAYLRHDAVVKKLNTILQSLPNHNGEANEMIAALSKEESIKPVEDVAYMLDKMDKFQLEDTERDYSSMNDEIPKAEDKEEMKKDFIQWLEEDGLPTSKSILAELKAINAAKENPPKPTTALDELERWIEQMKTTQHLKNGCSVENVHIPSLLHYIQELKTITP